MDLQEWRERKEAGEAMELPSGLVVHVRRAGLLDLAEQGGIPAPLAGMVESLLEEQRRTLTLEEVPEYSKVVNLVVRACVVEPPVGDEPGDEVLGIEELPIKDRMSVFNWANGMVATLRPFRPESESDVEPA